MEVFHYTDQKGFTALTSKSGDWHPSAVSTIGAWFFASDIATQLAVIACAGSKRLWEENDIRAPGAKPFQSAAYGPGWYATELPPQTRTDELLDALWLGDVSQIEKTQHWLRLSVDAGRVRRPDRTRPWLQFVPILDRVSVLDEARKLMGHSTEPVHLLEGGTRTDGSAGSVRVDTTYEPREAVCLVEPFICSFDGWTYLSPDQQYALQAVFGLDLPHHPQIPDDAFAITLTSKQYINVAWRLTKLAGLDCRLVRNEIHTYEDQCYRLSVSLEEKLSREHGSIHVLCLHQRSPVRVGAVREACEIARRTRRAAIVSTAPYEEGTLDIVVNEGVPLIVLSRDASAPDHYGLMADTGEVVVTPGLRWLSLGRGTDGAEKIVRVTTRSDLREFSRT